MHCRKGYEVVPQKCPMGFYLGTVDEEGLPNCRLSAGYANTAEEAQALLMDRQIAEENLFCNHGFGCFAPDACSCN